MGSMVSGLADAVLGVVEGVGLSADTVARYRKCCGVVVKFCDQRDLDALSARVVDEFAACQQERARRGEVGPNRRKALVKSARMMLEFQATGAVVWRMMSPDPDLTLSGSSRVVLKQFAVAAGLELAPASVRLLASEVRQFLACLGHAGRSSLGAVRRGRRPGVHGRDGTEETCGHRHRGVVAEEVLRLPQRRRAQRRPRQRPARACRAAAGAGAAVLYP
jgi:hypothetical protein